MLPDTATIGKFVRYDEDKEWEVKCYEPDRDPYHPRILFERDKDNIADAAMRLWLRLAYGANKYGEDDRENRDQE